MNRDAVGDKKGNTVYPERRDTLLCACVLREEKRKIRPAYRRRVRVDKRNARGWDAANRKYLISVLSSVVLEHAIFLSKKHANFFFLRDVEINIF